ncbi:putative alpha-dextrin endo-1, 6-alpha-glucosidase [Acidisarcina polymorpha]|uniref:Putative alpha-dextrin endo-1, 6-alpha-glucosidase n=1 Tax=Acidisarcina polymorpha TaxID=2211140 RepID=A0A2Z5G8Z9_9BACT|nr:alpha/beta hydrolase-fold protein [Acidisarcina polymorpha]AXC15469.1 putative alpha-dextrin endo-1, 6-alpha-glucosidase [Acidisarcina polymorpha]
MFIRLLFVFNLILIGTTIRSTLIAQSPAPPCKSTVTGTLEVVPLVSKVYGDKRFLRVWLPAGYSEQQSATKRYPVLYLFDGQDLFDRCTTRPGEEEWHVDEIMTGLVDQKAVQPLIVVGIDNSGPGHREEEYSRYSAMADAPQKLSAFMNAEVVSLIDRRFRTISDRTHRGVGGASLGSLAALTLLLDLPDTFGLGLLESTSLQNGNGRALQETSLIVQGPLRVSIGVGTTEVPPSEAADHGFPYFDDAFVAMNRTLAENMKKSLMNHPEVQLTVQQGGQHQDRYWSERFGPAMRFLFPPSALASR